MNHRNRYAADALMSDLAARHHHVRAASEKQVEEMMRRRYPEAVAILVRQDSSWRQVVSRSRP